MPENPLSSALGQVSALLTELRERSEAVTEQAQTTLVSSLGSAQDKIAESRGEVQTKVAATVEGMQTRWDDTVATAVAPFEEARTKLAALPVELPVEIEELKSKFSPEELRKVADAYLAVAAALLASVSDRAEEAVGKITSSTLVEGGLDKLELEKIYSNAVAMTEGALGTIAAQTPFGGGRGKGASAVEQLPQDDAETPAQLVATSAPARPATAKKAPVKKAPVKKAPVKKAPAKKAAAKKVPAKKVPAKKAAAKKAPAEKAPAKKTAAPAKKTPAKKTSATTAAAKNPAAKKAAAKKTPAAKTPAAKKTPTKRSTSSK